MGNHQSSQNWAEKIRRNAGSKEWSFKSVTAIILFGAIVLVFVFFGLPSQNSGQGVGSAAVVNASLISVADLRNETQRLEQFYASFMGNNGDMGAQRQFLTERALENLINSELLAQQASKEGILGTDAEIRDFIVKDITAFQKDGRFQREYYQNYLTSVRSSAKEFETKIRKDRQSQRSRRLFEISFQPIKLEVSKQKDLRENKMNVAFVKLEKEQLDFGKSVTDVEAKDFLAKEENAKKAEDYYNSNVASYTTEEQVKAQHILIKVDPAVAGSDQAALEKIKGLRARADKEDFGKLASENSEDPGSKTNKGDLGFFGRGRMVPEFEKTAFEMKPGQISEPVKTSFGYHIIKVTEKKAAKKSEFAEVKNEIAKKLIGEEKLDSQTKAIEEALAKGDEATVEKELKALGASWQETGDFDLNTDAIPKLNSTVASQSIYELTKEKPLLPRLIRDGGQKFVLKLKNLSKGTASVDEKAIGDELGRSRGYDVFNNWVESIRKSSKVEKNPSVLQVR